jgi:DNA-directed RNA polymerase specialized sigma24 family protein
VLDARRSRRRRPEVPVALVPDARYVGGDDDVVRDDDGIEALLDGLPSSQRAVLYLRYVLDLPQGEVATILDSTVAAVKMQQRRGMDAIARKQGLAVQR